MQKKYLIQFLVAALPVICLTGPVHAEVYRDEGTWARVQASREREAIQRAEIQNRVNASREREAIQRAEIQNRVYANREREAIQRAEIQNRVNANREREAFQRSANQGRSGYYSSPVQYSRMQEGSPRGYVSEVSRQGYYHEGEIIEEEPVQYYRLPPERQPAIQQAAPAQPQVTPEQWDFHHRMVAAGWEVRKTASGEVTSISYFQIPKWAVYFRLRNNRLETYPAEDPKITARKQREAAEAAQRKALAEQQAREEAYRQQQAALKLEQERQAAIARAEAERQRLEAEAAEAERKRLAAIEAEKQQQLAIKKAQEERQARYDAFVPVMKKWEDEQITERETWRNEWLAKVGTDAQNAEKKWRADRLKELADRKLKDHISKEVAAKIEAEAPKHLPVLQSLHQEVIRLHGEELAYLSKTHARFLDEMREHDNIDGYNQTYNQELPALKDRRAKERAELTAKYEAEQKRRTAFGTVEQLITAEMGRYPIRWSMPDKCPYLFQSEVGGEITLFMQQGDRYVFVGYVTGLRSFGWFENQAALVADSIDVDAVPNPLTKIKEKVKEQLADFSQRGEKPLLILVDNGAVQNVLGGFPGGVKPFRARPMEGGKWRLWLKDEEGKSLDYAFEIDRQTGEHDINEAPSLGDSKEFFEK